MNRFFTYVVVILTLLSWPAMANEEKAKLFTVSYAQAEEAVSTALANKGAAEKIAAFLNGRQNDVLYSHSKPISIETRGIQFDKTAGRWSANLLIRAENEIVTAMPASGRFDVLAEIPVLRRTVKHSEVIASTDVEVRDIAISQVRSDTVTDMASLIGKSPAYSITAGRPIRTHEIDAPAVIKKNSLVQMRYRSPGMEITASGQAMEDGRKGEVINVKNIASKKIVQTMVEDVASVIVTAPNEKRAELSVKPSLGDLYATN